MVQKDKTLDEARQPREQPEQPAEGVRASAEEAAAALAAQMVTKDELIRAQAEKIAELQQQLDHARNRDVETARMMEIRERENAEILAVLENMNSSVGWKLVKRYRRFKERLLSSGTLRRRLYDRLLIRLNRSPSPSTFRSTGQPTPQKHQGTLPMPPDDFYRAQLVLVGAPAVLGAGQAGTATVEITNLSECTWEAMRKEPAWRGSVRLSYHWYDHAGKVVQWDGERTNLPHDLGPQDSVTLDAQIFAPFDPGAYTLEMTLVQEGIAWFDQKGSAGLRAAVRVDPSPLHLQQLPSCSIVIPVLNRASFTKACLLAIEKSVPLERLPYEVIVVDNGSTDETPRLLASWSNSCANARVVSMGHNLGFARACNAGARLARGQHIVLLNNDTLPAPGWLEKMMALAMSEAQVGIVGSKLLFPNGRIQHIGMVFDKNKNPRHIYRGFPADIPPARISREYQAVTGACLLVPRDLYWSVNGMDERYENSFEDVDLCLKVRAHGYRVLVCADSVVYHFESITEGRRACDFRNKALFKVQWDHMIEFDTDRWYALDNLRDESTEFEAPEDYNPRKENLLQDLWRRVYSCPLPNWEFDSSSTETESALDVHFGDHSTGEI